MVTQNRTSRQADYRIILVETAEQKGSIPIEASEGKVFGHYQPRALVPRETLVQSYGTSERLEKAIQAGVENARAFYNVNHRISPRITIDISEKRSNDLKITTVVPGEEPIIITDGEWENR